MSDDPVSVRYMVHDVDGPLGSPIELFQPATR